MVNEKINLQQLAKELAERKQMPQKKAEAFLREFFDAIIRNVALEKNVKVGGLGSFKLIEVLERESVNVNTGERIVIPGHTKLSFTPDTSLRDAVNKPFADFQTVIINEGTSLEEMERIDSVEPEEEQEVEIDDEPEAEPESEVQPEAGQEDVPEVVVEAESKEEPEQAPEALALLNQPSPAPSPSPVVPAKGRALTAAEKWALSLGVILLCVLCYFLGYHHVFDSLTIVPQKQEIKKAVPAPKKASAKAPVVKEDTISSAPAEEKTVESIPPQKEASQSLPDASKKYQIVGTRRTHIMKPGDYLTKIAVQEYGDKDFARYIIAHNNFRDPDNVPVGMEIKLPELQEVK